MFRTLAFVCLSCLVVGISARSARAGVVLEVSAQASPFFAGMPSDTTLPLGDTALGQAPVEVVGLDFAAGSRLIFSAFGFASYNNSEFSGPDGLTNTPALRGASFGISGYQMPLNALVGVFLGPLRPDVTPSPAALNFLGPGGLDQSEIAPMLKQVFFIGDGRTFDGVTQTFVVPTGATRLFLGVADFAPWNNNGGSYQVEVDLVTPLTSIVPEPSTLAAAVVGLLGTAIAVVRRRGGCRRSMSV
ncbi:MAG: PEP-CTERM sorting domain-containing protein [Isosphaeraceae bacterium]|nr:PEP-CTERM sorting domain-containing protein [Isosphaeraceae bacterium]